MRKINWGIIGLGKMALEFAKCFSHLDNVNLKGVASQKKENLKIFKRFGVDDKFCFNNYDDLISSRDIDIIYIALPNSLHSHFINECVKKNKNCLVEKPAFINFEDLKKFKDLDKNKKIFFTEAFMYRYLPYFLKIKEIIQNNILGNIVNMKSSFNITAYKQKNFFGLKIRKPDYSHRLFNKSLGGGAILDIGCYPLSLSTFINSLTHNIKLDNISLEDVYTDYCESGVDIFSRATLNFDNKFKSKIACSFKDKFNQQTIINFENGSLTIDRSWKPNQDMTIELKKNGQMSKINFKNNKNIYSYQIQNISHQLLNKGKTPQFPSMTIEEIEINTKILDEWINFK